MRLRIVTALALVLAACGGAGDQDAATSPSVDDPGTTAVAGSSTPAPDPTGPDPTGPDPTGPDPTGPDPTGPAPSTTGSPDPASTTAEPPGEPAPDFTMALSDGSSFTLSAEQKPVYMVFWAEW